MVVGGPACCYFFKLAIFFFPSSRYVFFLLLFAFDRLMNKKRTDGHFSNWKQISFSQRCVIVIYVPAHRWVHVWGYVSVLLL